ncbi:MAG: ribonuclease P protein component [Alistipes sp.]
MLVSVSKRNHKRANVRSLLKRRIREAYRLNRNPLRRSREADGSTWACCMFPKR